MIDPAVISAILFDADGVLQRARPGWRERLASCVAPEAGETFMAEVFAAEVPMLIGGDFTPALQRVLDRWQVDRPVREVLEVWQLIIIDEQMINAIRRLRAGGIRCYLATNQQNVRVRRMRSMPEYDGVFDDAFYSYELGLAKPDPAYFREILDRIGTPAKHVLFLDDNKINVNAALSVGLRAELFPRDCGIPGLVPLLRHYALARPARAL